MSATAAGKDGHGPRLRGIGVSAELPDVKPYVLAHSICAKIAPSVGDRRVKGAAHSESLASSPNDIHHGVLGEVRGEAEIAADQAIGSRNA